MNENAKNMNSGRSHSRRSNSAQSVGRMIGLVLLGVAVFYGGTRWLTLMVPAALLVWYGTGPALWSGRN